MTKRSIVTIGVFDGVHIGHQAVIKKVVARAKAAGAASIVVTFDPHPRKVLGGMHIAPSLISLKHRVNLIKNLGVDKVVVMRFDKRLSGMSAVDFINDVVLKRFNAKEIFIGEDFCFGRNASVGLSVLKKIGEESGLKVNSVRHIKKNGHVVSSSFIRRLVMSGKVKEASLFLGRPYSILGTVVSGAALARSLGYPTANINPHHEVVPPIGVYAVRVKRDCFGPSGLAMTLYKGIMNIGVRPTFYDHGRDIEPSIEVHIFDFHGKIYGKDLEIIFVKRIRSEKKFKTIDSLIEQVKRDVRLARRLLG